MTHKLFGFWLGTALLAASACATTSGQGPGNGYQSSTSTRTTTNPGPNAQTPDQGAAAPSGETGAAPGAQANNDNATSVAQQKNAVMASADGSQPATVQGYSNGSLTVAGQKQGTPRTMNLNDGVPIFEGDTRVGTDALTPGSDVRVYYRNPVSGAQREVIGIDIVTPGQGTSAAPGGIQNPVDREPSPDTGMANPSDENPKQGPGTDE